MIEVDFDSDRDGIIVVHAHDARMDRAFDGFYSLFRNKLHQMQKERPVRILIDISRIRCSQFCFASRTLRAMKRIFSSDDRVVLLTGNLDQKQGLRKFFAGTSVAVFSSRLPSEMWLVSDMDKPY